MSTKRVQYPNGRWFYLEDPNWDLDQLVLACSKIPRFNGGATKFISVAEHCVRVSYLIQEEGGVALEGLLHDVLEGLIGDMPSPVKKWLPDYQALEEELWRSLITWLQDEDTNKLDPVLARKLDPDKHSYALQVADLRALMIEAREVRLDQGRSFEGYKEYAPTDVDMPCYFWEPEEAYDRWMIRWEELTWPKRSI